MILGDRGEAFGAYQEHALKWLGDIDPASADDFKGVLFSSLKLFAGIAAIKKKIREIADRPRLIAECEVLVRTKGLVAPFLPTEALIAHYAEDFGQQRTLDEIRFAVVQCYPLSYVADRLARYTQNRMREHWTTDPITRIATPLSAHPHVAILSTQVATPALEAPFPTPIIPQREDLDLSGDAVDLGIPRPVDVSDERGSGRGSHQDRAEGEIDLPPETLCPAALLEPELDQEDAVQQEIPFDTANPKLEILSEAGTALSEAERGSPINQAAAKNLSSVSRLVNCGISRPLQPVMIVGAPGHGKGMLTSYALTYAVVKGGAEAWVIDPKSDRQEAGYWSRVAKHYLIDPTVNGSDFGELVLGIISAFEARQYARKNELESRDTPLILLIDEVNTIAANMTKLEVEIFGKKVISLAAQGRSQNVAVWISSQAVILKQLGIEGVSNRDIFTQVVCVDGEESEKAVAIVGTLWAKRGRASDCKAGRRYWMTPSETLVAPTLPTPPQADWGSNVIDLRPPSGSAYKAESFSPSPTLAAAGCPNEETRIAEEVQPTAPRLTTQESSGDDDQKDRARLMAETAKRVALLLKNADPEGMTRGAINQLISPAQRTVLSTALRLLCEKYGYRVYENRYQCPLAGTSGAKSEALKNGERASGTP